MVHSAEINNFDYLAKKVILVYKYYFHYTIILLIPVEDVYCKTEDGR